MIKAAVIGLGAMGKNHARIYADLEDVELIGICDADEKIVEKFSNKYNTKAFTDCDELIAEKPDIVSIATPTVTHKEIAIKAFENDINVLLEKPIAGTISDANEIIAAKGNKKLMIGHIERFNPAIIELKKHIHEIGKIIKIEARRLGPFPPRVQDVGVIVDLSVHDIDIMNYIIGSNVENVFGTKRQKIHSKHEDMVSGILEFENGAVGILSTDWLTPTKIRELTVLGEKGMFKADYLTQELTFFENASTNNLGDYEYKDIIKGVSVGQSVRYSINKKEPLLAEIENFVDAVKNNKEPLISGEAGLKALEIALKLTKK